MGNVEVPKGCEKQTGSLEYGSGEECEVQAFGLAVRPLHVDLTLDEDQNAQKISGSIILHSADCSASFCYSRESKVKSMSKAPWLRIGATSHVGSHRAPVAKLGLSLRFVLAMKVLSEVSAHIVILRLFSKDVMLCQSIFADGSSLFVLSNLPEQMSSRA